MTDRNTNRVNYHGSIEGLEAREIVPASEYCDRCKRSIEHGDNFRFQLGRTIIHTVRFEVTEADGRATKHKVKAPVFELVAFGRSFEAAVHMLKQSRLPSALRNDEAAKKALEALMA